MPRQFRALFIIPACALGCVWNLYSQSASAEPQPEPKRLALLLGNTAYRHLPPLPAVPGELDLMRSALRGAGFDVVVERDFTLDKLQKIVFDFLGKIHPGDVCFFYFDGYAMQWQQGNYLLPIEFDPSADQQDITSSAVELIGIQQNFDQKTAGLKILALEARGDASLMRQGVGLANPELSSSSEIIFAFSARPGQLAQDNQGAFTKALAGAIAKKGLNQDELFREVQKMASLTYILPSVTKDFYFHKPEKPPDPVPAPPPPPTVIFKEAPAGPKPGTLATNHMDREDYVWIPAGTFKMGCVPSDEKCKKPEELPQHTVTISKSFWMGRNEVQTGSYRRYVEDDKDPDKNKRRKMPSVVPAWDSKWKLSSYPIVEVSADDAEGYCKWAGGRLPTEAEWEYAARAGIADQINPLPDGDASREKANFDGIKGNDKWPQAAPVRSFDPNPWGLFDMAGNVWEWCKDFFSKTYYQESPAIDPQGPAGTLHVVRGGSWDSDPKQHLRMSYRESHKLGNTVGFRCVLPDNSATAELLKPR